MNTSYRLSLRCGRRPHGTFGFTLVEIMIVVAILGILAAMVIPKFTNATEMAKYSSLKNTIKIVRSQMSLYKTQHNDDWPDLVTDGWDVMTSKTDADHTVNTASGLNGPYLQKVPINAFTNGSTLSDDESNIQDWYYDASNGEFKAFVPEDLFEKLSTEDPDIITYVVTPSGG